MITDAMSEADGMLKTHKLFISTIVLGSLNRLMLKMCAKRFYHRVKASGVDLCQGMIFNEFVK